MFTANVHRCLLYTNKATLNILVLIVSDPFFRMFEAIIMFRDNGGGGGQMDTMWGVIGCLVL